MNTLRRGAGVETDTAETPQTLRRAFLCTTRKRPRNGDLLNRGSRTNQQRLDELEDRSSALKLILVACFGYQGFSNAKFGRIECHEAINAYAREIL